MAHSKVSLLNAWRWLLFFAVLATVAGCGGSAPEGAHEFEPPTTVDTGPDATPPTTFPTTADAGRPDAVPASPPVPGVDAGHDSQALAPDGHADAGPLMVRADAGFAGQDARPGADAAAFAVDAVAATDAPDSAVPPVCNSAAPVCAQAQAADDEIRATFPQPCTTADRQCGGVIEGGHLVITYPMLCMFGRWRLAGSWYAGTWVPTFTCSMGCGSAGTICAP